MAILTTVTPTIASVQTRKLAYPSSGCAALGWKDVWAVKTVRKVVTQDYEKESRPFPTDLVNAMTSRPSIYGSAATAKVLTRTTRKSATCYVEDISWGTPPDWISFYTNGLLADPPATYWETKARLAIKGLSVNLGASTFEFRETSKMFLQGARALYNGYRDLRKGRFLQSIKATPCNLASAELMASFGLNPLLGTIYDSMQQMQRVFDNPLYRQIKVKETRKSTRSWTPPTQKGLITSTCTRRQKASIHVRLNVGPSDFIMGNPAEVAWELVPFSWLVDGFISIGDYLSSLDAMKEVHSLIGTLSTRDRYTIEDALQYYSDSYTMKKPARGTLIRYQRSVLTDIPMGPMPKLELGKSWFKLMHATSALVQMTKPCKPSPWRSNRPFTKVSNGFPGEKLFHVKPWLQLS